MHQFWSLNEGTFYCLYDEERTQAFRNAISRTVSAGDVVVDLGAGSGVLSMFAADAGASKVYAVELEGMNVATLRETLRLNGYERVIEVVHADATAVALPEPVDVVICEMIATGLIEELQVPAMNHAHSLLRSGGRILLERYDITAALVRQRNRFYGKDFHVVRYEFPDAPDLASVLMSEEALLRQVDFRHPIEHERVDRQLAFTALEHGVINGLRIGGRTNFADGSTFGHSITYSFPSVLPVEPFEVQQGDRVDVAVAYDICKGPATLRYRVTRG